MSRPLQNASLALLAAVVLGISACGGGGNNSSSPPPAPACISQAVLGTPQTASGNVAPITVDGGPVVGNALAGTINQAYTSVTVCAPGTSNCQTIDHVWVDTGSYGLRLMCTPFVAKLPPSQQNGNTVANCGQFVTSYIWGAVRTADVKIGGESASSIPLQVIADAAVPATAPSSCSTGTAQNTVSGPTGLGANGILGIGVFREDCGPGCAAPNIAPSGWYYTCPGGTCQPVNMATGLQLQNVVGHFATDNNGSLIQLPPLTAAGAATATGSLIFGIGTQANNALGSAMVFGANPASGLIQTSTLFGDLTEPASYIDSGSNAFFFNNSSLAQCTGMSAGLYCPAATTPLTATMLPFDTPTNPASFTYNFSIANIASSPNLAFNNVGGPSGPCNNTSGPPCTFAWGLPFFYGRTVFTALEMTTINGTTTTGPFFAATTP